MDGWAKRIKMCFCLKPIQFELSGTDRQRLNQNKFHVFTILRNSKYLRMVIQHEPCTKYGNQMEMKRRKKKTKKIIIWSWMPEQQQMENEKFFSCCQLPYAIRINRANVQFVYGGNLVFVRLFIPFFVFVFFFLFHVVDANSFSTRYVFLMSNDACSVPYHGNGNTHYTCSIFFVSFLTPHFSFLILSAAQQMNYYVSCSLFYPVFNSIWEFSVKLKKKNEPIHIVWMKIFGAQTVLILYTYTFYPTFPYSSLNRAFACGMCNFKPKKSLTKSEWGKKSYEIHWITSFSR